MKRFLIPPSIFLVLIVGLGAGLRLTPHAIPSPLIGKPAPAFTLAQLEDGEKKFSPQDMRGKVWLLNVWASWCAPCRHELPVLVAFARQGVVPIVGLNYTDARADGRRWLGRFGNPYQLSAADADGRVGIAYGVYGMPETFVIDKFGVIRMKYSGALTIELIQHELLPLIRELNRA